ELLRLRVFGEPLFELPDIGFNSLDVTIGSRGIRVIEKSIEALEVLFDLRFHILSPEERRLAHQILDAREVNARIGLMRAEMLSFGKFFEKDRELLDVIVRGHLAEEIARAQGKPNHFFDLALERDARQVHVDTGAADHVLNRPNI